MQGIKRAITSCVKYIYNQQIISSTKQYLLKGKTILNPKQSNQNLYCNGVPYRSKFIQFTWSLTFIGSAVFIFQRYVVCIWNLEGESNVPTFEDGDIVLVCKNCMHLFSLRMLCIIFTRNLPIPSLALIIIAIFYSF